MGEPFANEVVGGGGALVIPQIRSPDFAEGVSGWEIRIDGSAEFNNLGIRGTFNGTDFIINSSGAFFYNGTPAAGNLIASIAPIAGTDQFGNAYAHGVQLGEPGATSQIRLLPGLGGQASEVQFHDPTGSLSNEPNLAAGLGGAQSSVLLSGPAKSTAGIKDWVQFILFSNDGAGTPANMQFNYISNAQVASLTAFYNGSGWTFQIPVTMIAGLSVFGGLSTDTLSTTGNAVIGGNATIGNGSSLNNLTLSPKMATPPHYVLPTDPNSGTAWATGERQYINNCVDAINAIISSMQNHGMMT